MNNCEDMNSKEREVMELALEALETYKNFIDDAHIIEGQWHWINGLDDVQTAIKEALANHIPDTKQMRAQPEQDADRFCDANCTWSDHHPNCKYGKPEQRSSEQLEKNT